MLISLAFNGLPGYEEKIITGQVQAPGAEPTEWIAYRQGTDPTDEDEPIGRGLREEDAIMDLLDVEAFRRGE